MSAAVRFRFIGQHTNGRTSITYADAVFEGSNPATVTDPDMIRRLRTHPEFEIIHPLDHDGDGELGGSLPHNTAPRKRGRPKKVSL